MRLRNVESGHRLKQRLILKIIRWSSGRTAPDVLRTLMYRPEFFGQAFSEWVQDIMRGASNWSVGERELFAAFTSRLNQCRF